MLKEAAKKRLFDDNGIWEVQYLKMKTTTKQLTLSGLMGCGLAKLTDSSCLWPSNSRMWGWWLSTFCATAYHKRGEINHIRDSV